MVTEQEAREVLAATCESAWHGNRVVAGSDENLIPIADAIKAMLALANRPVEVPADLAGLRNSLDVLDVLVEAWVQGREVSDEEGRRATAGLMTLGRHLDELTLLRQHAGKVDDKGEDAPDLTDEQWQNVVRNIPKPDGPLTPVAGSGDALREAQFEVWQDDMMVAASTDEADARHYLAVYQQDGPATLFRAETTRTALSTETSNG